MISAPDGLILAITALCLAICAVLSFRSLPSRLRRTCEQACDVALEADRKVDRLQAGWAEEKLRLQGIVETLEDLRDQVEKKRARAVSAEARATRQVELPQDPDDLKMQLRRQAGLR